jgi:predicted PurR-regulated permease PerM
MASSARLSSPPRLVATPNVARDGGAESEQNNAARRSRWLIGALSLGAVLAFVPLWEPLLLAAFAGIVAHPLHERLSRKLGGRERAAALVTMSLVIAVLIPTAIAGVSLYRGVLELASRLQHSSGGYDALRQLVSGDGAKQLPLNGRALLQYLRENGLGALAAAQTVFGAATTIVVDAFVFALGFHACLVDGRRGYHWFLTRSPIPREHFVRLSQAFNETARGLLVGIGLTAVLQGAIATLGYALLGVPQAAVLGVLTTLAALIPSIGTALVWVPVTAGLFLAGRSESALILLSVGLFVSVVDNIVRPMLSRYGKLDLSAFIVLVAMLGGVAAFGGFGLLLGPLLVRLALEGWRILHDDPLGTRRPPTQAKRLAA